MKPHPEVMLTKEIHRLVLQNQEPMLQEKCQVQETTPVDNEKCQVQEEMAADKEKCQVKEVAHSEMKVAQEETEEVNLPI